MVKVYLKLSACLINKSGGSIMHMIFVFDTTFIMHGIIE
jgi:hypothetical protein